MAKKIILHLCADVGSDSRYYSVNDAEYTVIRVGEQIGVENYIPPKKVYGIIANPVCTEFSNAKTRKGDHAKGMLLVDHCRRIIEAANPVFWVIENPASGALRQYLGKPGYTYQPWMYGSPWTKNTALWGKFNIPPVLFKDWQDVPKNNDLYIRPGRIKPSLAHLHKSAIHLIPEFAWCSDLMRNDSDIRSLCSDGFAREFYRVNR